MSRPSRPLSKSATNTKEPLRKISKQNGQISKVTKSISIMPRTSDTSKIRNKSATAKLARNKNVLKSESAKESEVGAASQNIKEDTTQDQSGAQELTTQNQEGRNEEIEQKTSNAIPKLTRASFKSKVKVKTASEKKSFRNENILRRSGITATEVGAMLQKPEQIARQQAGTDATDEIEESREHKRATQESIKCFDDWKDFYLQIFGCVKSKSDLIVAFTHYVLMKNGFRCLGLGDDRTYTEDEVGSISLPEGWNHFPKYAIRYINNRMLHLLLAIHLDHRLLINLLNTRTNVVTNITVFPEITVRATCGGPLDVLIPHPEKLAQNLYYNLMQTFTDTTACGPPPKILSRVNQQDNPWHELEARHSKNVYPIAEEDNVLQLEESNDVQMFETENKHYGSLTSKQSGKHTSWADIKPFIASAKKLKPLKTALDEAVPPLKEAIASYMETMVDNWCRIYGREVMKSGQLAIQDLTEQRKMIEKYIDLAKPVTAPKGGFIIYNTKVTLDDSRQRLLHKTFERDFLQLKSSLKSNQNDFGNAYTEVAPETSLTQHKSDSKAQSKNVCSKEETGIEEKQKFKNRKNYKHISPKVCTGRRMEKINLKPLLKKQKGSRVKETAKKTENSGNAFQNSRLEKAIENATALLGLRKSIASANVNRKEGGSDTYSLQQNSSNNSEAKTRRARLKLKSATTVINNTKSKKGHAFKLISSAGKGKFGKADTQIRLSRSSPIKKIHFNLPKFGTQTYVSNKWPSTYKSVENLLNNSFPFRVEEQERNCGGSEQSQEFLDHYNLSDLLTIKPLSNLDSAITEGKKQQKSARSHLDIEKSPGLHNNSFYSLQSIEEHFADQIEAKRLELLERVRRRDIERIMESSDNIQMKQKFIQPKREVDVGCFVQPADDWSQWEFKKKLKEIRDKEILGVNLKKANFRE